MQIPPGLSTPAAIQTFRFVTQPLPLFDECAARFGDVFTIRLVGSGSWVMFSKPEHIKTLFGGDPEYVRGGEANAAIFAPLTGTTSSLVIDGQSHAKRRRTLTPPFAGERMRAYAGTMAEITASRIAEWPRDRAMPLEPKMRQIALQVILRSIFGLDRGAEAQRLAELLVKLGTAGVGSPLLFFPLLQWDLGRYSPWGRIMHLRRQADEALYAEIARRRASGTQGREDILSLLLSTRNEDGRPLTDIELRDELVTMLFAGHETTALALTWSFERILSYPEVERRLHDELMAVVGDKPVTAADVPRLEYLDAVIKESLRVRPIGPVAGNRRLTAPFEIAGYTVPAGAIVANCCYLGHKRAEVYPEPERFNPDRFLNVKPQAHEWTPFGGGQRRCPGANFAAFEMKVVIATILRTLQLRLVHPSRRVERRGFFIGPEAELPVLVQNREEMRR